MPEFGTPFEGIELDRKISKEETIRALRFAISAEFEAVQLYKQISNATNEPDVKAVMDSVANEEKVHAGEFMKALFILDPSESKYYEDGFKEVEKLVNHKHI